MLKIKFQGQEFLFIGDSLDDGGAIATEEQYTQGLDSYAHLFPYDGAIKRFGVEIGRREDIEVLEADVDIKMSGEGIVNTIRWFLG